MTLKPWKILSSTHTYPNVRLDLCELPNGRHFEGRVYEFGDWVTVLALTPRQEVVLIRQYRHGLGRVIIEFPGGMLDGPHETPEKAARRELFEETGFGSECWVQVGCLSPNPAIQNNMIHFFLALDASRVDEQHLDDTEEIDVHLRPLDEVVAMAKAGELVQSMQVAALFFALSYLEKLQG